MVWAEELDANQLVESMERGEFYASTGVVLEKISYDQGDRKHSIKIAPLDGVDFETKFIGTHRSTPDTTGEVFATISGTSVDYQLTGDELYVRAVITSTREHSNPSYSNQKEQAWTQPVGWRK